MKVQDPIKSIMSNKLISLHPKDKIQEAKELFEKYPIHHIPIVVMNKLVGILSLGDILFLSKKPIMSSFDAFIRDQKLSIDAVEEIMTTDIITINSDATINDALEKMINFRVNAIPVIENQELIGLVTSFDILKNVVE